MDPPIANGQRMIVIAGDGTRRPDLVGITGSVEKKTIQRQTYYLFMLDNGEVVTSDDVWWRRESGV